MGCGYSRQNKVLNFSHITSLAIYEGKIEHQQNYLSIDNKLSLLMYVKFSWSASVVVLKIHEVQLNEHYEGQGTISRSDLLYKAYVKFDPNTNTLKINMSDYSIELY